MCHSPNYFFIAYKQFSSLFMLVLVFNFRQRMLEIFEFILNLLIIGTEMCELLICNNLTNPSLKY